MPKILNLIVKVVSVTALSVAANSCYGQYAVKQTVSNGTKTSETAEYYTYNRMPDSYNALSVKTVLISKTGVKPAYQLNITFTTSLPANTVQKLKFETVADSSVQITTPLIADGIKPIDNKKLTCSVYHVTLTDSVKLFLAQHTLKTLVMLDSREQAITRLPVDAVFISQQLVCLQTSGKPKLPVKKYHKKST